MPRQRMIKADFFDSGSLAQVSILARYLFIGMWVFADDKGNLKYQTLKLRKQVFPYDEMDEETFVDALVSLEDVGCIYGYEIDGERYIAIPNFLTYQTINRPSSSTIPEPETVTNKHLIRLWKTVENYNTHGVFSEYSVSTHHERKKEGRKEETNLIVSSSFQVDSFPHGAAAGGGNPTATPDESCGCPEHLNPYKAVGA